MGAVFLMARRNIFLIGMMAVGKSTVGLQLAKQLGLEFFDTDRVIEERAGADIAWIFDVEGEDGFRDREETVLDELTQREGVVLATGGGVILRPANRQHLASRGTVVYLRTTLERLVARTRNDRRRPLLADGDVEATLERLMDERADLYAQTADIEVFAAKGSAASLVQDIMAKLEATT